MRTLWIAKTMALLLALSGGAGMAAENPSSWPNKPVRLVVPFPPGGSTDAVARLIADRLSSRLKQQFVVENRPGAGGNIGTAAVAHAKPDGYTLTLSTSGPLANNKFLYQSMTYDPERDLSPIVLVGVIPLVIATSDKTPVQDLQELIALFKQEPGKYSVGNPGNGTIGHLAAELVGHTTGTEFISVPYRGDTPAMTDLLGGSIQAIVAPVTAFIPQIAAGNLNGLAIMADQRFPLLPDVPTAAEQGVDAEAAVWFAVAGPAGLPESIVEKLNAEINLILDSEEARTKLEQYGAVVGGGAAGDLGSLIRTESLKWKDIIDTAGIRLD